MKVDFSQILKSLDGASFQENDTPVTLATLCCAALMYNYPDDGRLSGEEKFKRYEVASKIYGKSEVDVTADEITRLKGVIGKFYGANLVGPAFVALDSGTDESASIKAPTEAAAAEAKTYAETPAAPKAGKRRTKLAAVPKDQQ